MGRNFNHFFVNAKIINKGDFYVIFERVKAVWYADVPLR